jgi:hypothetical protein
LRKTPQKSNIFYINYIIQDDIGVGVMRKNSLTAVLILGMVLFSFCVIFNSTILVKGENQEPILEYPAVYIYEDGETIIAEFGVSYRDVDGDEGIVTLTIDADPPVNMGTVDQSPEEGQYYLFTVPAEEVDDFTTFRFSADDQNGSLISFPSENEDPFQVGDFQGWGEPPVLSNPDVYFDGDDWIFNVTYWDVDEDEASWVQLILNDIEYIDMETIDPDPFLGQNYITRVLEEKVNEDTEFYFEAEDTGMSYTDLHDEGYTMFEVRDFDTSSNGGGGGSGSGDTGGGINFSLSEGWAEVLVGVIALAAIAGGSAYGFYRRRKKHGRFSELLTQLDEIYASYKLNPKRCETELEKVKGTINEDLKKSTIDDNNYSILKGRIDEILSEIRSESIRSEVVELPKDIEIKIKDMLIDGEITRAEYDKILPIIKGSAMSSDEKEKVKKMVESYMVEEKK